MKVESLRLLSFHENCHLLMLMSWQPWKDHLQALDPVILAKNGFCYAGVRGVVKCAFCSRRFYPNSYTTLKQLQDEHSQITPTCKFDTMNNIPIEKEHPAVTLPLTDQVFPGAFPLLPKREHTVHYIRDESHIYARMGYFNIEMINIEDRKKTFKLQKHPTTSEMIDKLASAGFFFKGPGQFVECYQCGLGLLWYNEEICPFEAHLLYNVRCSHTILMKGERFAETFKYRVAERVTAILNSNSTNDIRSVIKPTNTNKPAADAVSHSGDSTISCIICFNNPRNIILFPCRHIALCHECTSNINKCSVCNCVFKSFARVYIA
ncbi:MAG: hypothetical protein JHC26_06275 [Thermofilum sp.]|nr:hypothetical protein [Thermofilum sp.]